MMTWVQRRDEYPELEASRRRGMSRSPKIRALLDRIRPAAIEAAKKAMATDQRFMAGPLNQRSIPFHLVSPDLTEYQGVNLADFIRTHPQLFRAVDLVGRHPTRTRAYAGLYLIVSGRYPKWKGWTHAEAE